MPLQRKWQHCNHIATTIQYAHLKTYQENTHNMARKHILTFVIMALLVITGAIASAQDGRTPITPDNAGMVTELIRLGRGSAEDAVFAPDGSVLAVSGTVGVWLYDPANITTETEPTLLLTEEKVNDIVITPDGMSLVALLSDRSRVIWNLTTHERIQTGDVSYGGSEMAISPDGNLIAINAGSSGINLLDTVTWAETLLEGSFRSDSEVVFSTDGRWLAAVGSDNAIYVWDVANSQQAAKLEGHTSTPISLSFNPDSTMLVTGSADRTIRLWNVGDWTQASIIDSLDGTNLSSVSRVRFSPDGTTFVSGHNNSVVIWDALTGGAQIQISIAGTGSVAELLYSPDGTQIITIDASYQIIQAWDTSTGELTATSIGHTPSITALAFSPDSDELAFTDVSAGDLWLWDTTSMQEINFGIRLNDLATSSSSNITGIAYTSDGAYRAILDSFSVHLIDTTTNASLHELDIEGIAEGLTFSPDNSLLGVITSAGLHIFDVSSGEQLAEFTDHNDWLTSVAFSPNQTLIATSARDRTVRVYGLE